MTSGNDPLVVREHPHAINVRAAFAALGRGDFEVMSRRFADDIVWSVGGDNPLSGTYLGRDTVVDHLRAMRQLTRGTLRYTIEDILASDRYAAVFLRAQGQRDEVALDVRIALAIVFDDHGRWTMRFGLADDERAVNDFWGRPA
jgi:ketosteroid isomerase-like protein